jgi:hypothetical protein
MMVKATTSNAKLALTGNKSKESNKKYASFPVVTSYEATAGTAQVAPVPAGETPDPLPPAEYILNSGSVP